VLDFIHSVAADKVKNALHEDRRIILTIYCAEAFYYAVYKFKKVRQLTNMGIW